jgi:hypothetical protein
MFSCNKQEDKKSVGKMYDDEKGEETGTIA